MTPDRNNVLDARILPFVAPDRVYAHTPVPKFNRAEDGSYLAHVIRDAPCGRSARVQVRAFRAENGGWETTIDGLPGPAARTLVRAKQMVVYEVLVDQYRVRALTSARNAV